MYSTNTSILYGKLDEFELGEKATCKSDKENKMMYSFPLCKFVFMSPKGHYLTTDSNKPLLRLG